MNLSNKSRPADNYRTEDIVPTKEYNEFAVVNDTDALTCDTNNTTNNNDTPTTTDNTNLDSTPKSKVKMPSIRSKKRKPKFRLVTPNISLPDDIQPSQNPNACYAKNQIHTTKYNWITFLPKNLFEQFHRYANLYFLAIQILNWLPGMDVFVREIQMMPLLFVLSVTAIKDLFEDRRRHTSDKRVNNLKCRRYDKKKRRFVQISWQDLTVGDIVHLSCNEKVPADILLMRSQSVEAEANDDYGLCYVETFNLDGENNLKQRYVVPHFAHAKEKLENINFDFVVECDKPNMKLYKFHGYISYPESDKKVSITKENLLLRDCVLKNTSFVEGLVIYAGHETKAMLNNKGPRHKRSRLEKMMNQDIVWCIVILIVMCTVSSLGRKFFIESYPRNRALIPFLNIERNPPYEFLNYIWIFFMFMILYQMIIPISLYVCIEMVKLGQVYYIHRDDNLYDQVNNKRIECRALNITEDLGQVEYMFCDKTGTLTENKMEFRCCTIKGEDYSHDTSFDDACMLTYEQSVTALKNNKLKLHPLLVDKLNSITMKYSRSYKGKISKALMEVQLNQEEEYIRDFFILLAICNTAVAANKDAHVDVLNANGQIVSPQPEVILRKSALATPKSFMISNKSKMLNKSKTMKTFKIFNMFSPGLFKSNTKLNQSHPVKLKPIYESESPDEVALVLAAYNYRVSLLKRGKEYVNVMLPNGMMITYHVLNLLPFDSNRKRMSIIVRCPFTKQIVLFCKGSDQTVLEQLSPDYSTDSVKQNELLLTNANLKKYSTKGYRVLCMAKRVISEEEYQNWAENYKKAEMSFKSERKVANSVAKIESNLELLGATAIEDRLQYRVPEVIAALKSAGIVVWVLTGDKMETAINIAKSCRLFNSNMELIEISLENVKSKRSAQMELLKKIELIRNTIKTSEKEGTSPEANQNTVNQQNQNPTKANPEKSKWKERIKILYDVLNWRQIVEFVPQDQRNRWGLVIDGPSLNFVLEKDNLDYFIELTQYCSSVLCCRMTPSQKSTVVKCVKKKLNTLTVAVGDGANDVAMIQTAHVGIGISGLEGTQAVMASDFAISKFHFLERLILVHGNLCYNRLAVTILYFFYKNTIVIFVIFLFQFYCGFSGKSLLDDIYLMAVNIFYTTLPAMVRGIFEKDCDESVFLQYPSLYERGRKSRVYTQHSFWVNTTDSLYQSLVIFFLTYLFYNDAPIGITEFGLVVFMLIICTNLLQIAIETKFWNGIYVGSFVASVAFFLATAITLDYSKSYFIISTLGSHNYKVFQNTMSNYKFLLSLIIVPFTCMLPRITIRVLQEKFNPLFQV